MVCHVLVATIALTGEESQRRERAGADQILLLVWPIDEGHIPLPPPLIRNEIALSRPSEDLHSRLEANH